jgi:hypothetical protein
MGRTTGNGLFNSNCGTFGAAVLSVDLVKKRDKLAGACSCIKETKELGIEGRYTQKIAMMPIKKGRSSRMDVLVGFYIPVMRYRRFELNRIELESQRLSIFINSSLAIALQDISQRLSNLGQW